MTTEKLKVVSSGVSGGAFAIFATWILFKLIVLLFFGGCR